MIALSSPIRPIDRLQTASAFFLAFVMAAAIGIALGFEHIGGYMPCKLCLEERVPYYIGIPLMLFAGILSYLRAPGFIVRLLFIIAGLLMLYNFGLSIYHAGAEYKFWPGPTDCSAATTAITNDAGNLLGSLNSKRPPTCDTAAGYFLGLSFAGWNGVSSLFLALATFITAFTRFNKDARS